MFNDLGVNNEISVGDAVVLTGHVKGNGNRIRIENPVRTASVHLQINGDNNEIVIRAPFYIMGVKIWVGNHIAAHNVCLNIEKNVSIEPNGQFLFYNSGNRCEIGEECLFSKNLTIRTGESPHLLFDLETGESLDVSDGVFIGNHVWIGEDVYITKKSSIPDESVIGARSVVSRRFTERHSAMAGNPATVVRRGVQWVRNQEFLEKSGKFREGYNASVKGFPKPHP